MILANEELYAAILDNYNNQYNLYQQMADWSRQQHDLLEKNDWEEDRLNQVLEKRKAINDEIDILSQQNRQARDEFTSSLGLDEFVLSSLEKHLETCQYQSLQEVLMSLGKLLSEISEIDRQSNNMIRLKLESRKNQDRRDSRLVQNAYREAMQQAKKNEEI